MVVREKLKIAQLQVGLYIELPLKWQDHPFLTSKFLIKDREQLLIIQHLKLDEVWYYPKKSNTSPLPQQAYVPPTAPAAEPPPQVNAAWQEKQARTRALEKRRHEIQQVEKQYTQVVGQVKRLMLQMHSLPAQSIRDASEVVDHIVQALLGDQDTVIHLMNANDIDDSLYYHALNVSVLALLLAREVGLPEKLFSLLGFAALMHDLGQSRVPQQILRKTAALTKAERDLYQLHVNYGVELMKKLSETGPLVWDIVAQHHELCDGSGYPRGLKGNEMSELAKIVSIVNYYDELCNHNDPKQSLTPHEALSLMYGKLGHAFEKKYLQAFVRLLGIYPPGSVIQLSDERLGIVISLHRDALLKPAVLLYDADIPKAQAVILDLREHAELSIASSIKPGQLAPEVFDYLSPRERVSYFFKLSANVDAQH